ncbi:tetratricopeptide repeat protein [Lutimaribacter marinistellae]|uniref:Tetratricopeptide repeat protein n=1 Tax=Lutimaribacter marinistellae TaxID=1820329 RepID=A0ABV7TMW7_9RHOB
MLAAWHLLPKRRNFLYFAKGVVLGLCLAAPAGAQEADTSAETFAALEARRAALFQATLSNPVDLDIAFEYALISARVGDIEAAISTMERILVFNPGLPRVQLELAVLYYRIGAIETAQHYLEAVRGQDLPPAVRAKVDEFSLSVEEASKPYRFSASIDFGMQAYSNANFAPDRDSIIIGGVPINLGPGAKAQSDASVFALGQIHYTYDLPAQGALFEVDGTLYASKFFELSRLDLNFLEVAFGPSFNLGRWGWDKSRLGVYGIVGGSTLGGSHYSTIGGAGLRLRTQIDNRTLLETQIEARSINYSNTADYPNATLQDGNTYRFRAQLIRSLSPGWTGSFAFEARQVDGETDFNTFRGYGLTAKLNHDFRGPTDGILADNEPWSLLLAVGGISRDFAGPDPLIDPVNAQDDRGLWLEASLGIPLENQFSAYVTGQYYRQNSNYPTRDYDGVTLTYGVKKRF